MKKKILPTKKSVLWSKTAVDISGISKNRQKSETAFQVYSVTWLRKNYPHLVIHHSANEREGGKSGLTAKLMGQTKGFPDLLIFDPIAFVKIAIEFKLPGQKLRPEQTSWLKILALCGFECYSVWSFEGFKEIIDSNLSIYT
jgi:hypothetical protein